MGVPVCTIKQNIADLSKRIRFCEQKAINSKPVTLLAVSKQRTAEEILTAVEADITDVGENYLQEALLKIDELGEQAITWHFIGPIQSNKCKDIAQNFNWVHTIDRLKIAQKLSDSRPITAAR